MSWYSPKTYYLGRIMWKRRYVGSFLLWRKLLWTKLFKPFKWRGYTFDECYIKIYSMKINFNVCGGPRMGSLVMGSSCKTKPTFWRVSSLHKNIEWPPRSPDWSPVIFSVILFPLLKFRFSLLLVAFLSNSMPRIPMC